jgi:guanine nucleotide-binding protein subunit alpha
MSKFLRRRSTLDVEGDDPLTTAMAPPANETPEEREARLLAQAEAQKRSDAIDEEINRQRNLDKKAPKCVRVLLLGKNINCSGSPFIVIRFFLLNRPERIR